MNDEVSKKNGATNPDELSQLALPNETTRNSAPPESDLGDLRLSQDFGVGPDLKKPLLTIPIRKPAPSWFIQVHQNENFWLETMVIDLKNDGGVYLVKRTIWPELADEPCLIPVCLYTACARPGDHVFLLPVRLPGPDGRLDPYNQSLHDIVADFATRSWVRIRANKTLGTYGVITPPPDNHLPAPVWPEESFMKLLEIAARNRFVDSINHPIIQQLRGAI